MEEQILPGSIELIVPANHGMMLVVRMTAAGALAWGGMTLDAVDDLKMAAEEACTCLMMQPRPCTHLHLVFQRSLTATELTVTGAGRSTESEKPQEPYEMDVIRCILESMVDTVCMESDEYGLTSIKMTKAIS